MGATIPPTHKQSPFASPVARVLAVIIVSFTLTLTGIIGYILSARNYATHTGFLAQNGQLLKVRTTRGKTIALGVEVPQENLGGLWASDQGLTLTLEGINTPLTVVEPKQRSWGDSIQDATIPSFTLNGSVTIPESIGNPEQRTLSGQLNGTVTYPAPKLFSFVEHTVEIRVPVQFQLVPPGSIEDGQLLFDAFSAFSILFCIALSLWDLWLLFLRPIVMHGYGRTTGILRQMVGGLIVSIIGGLILWGLFTLAIDTGLSTHLHEGISQRTLLISCLAGAALLLTYITLFANLGQRSKN
ncbi:MAG TPA: hypothetical protein VFU49_17820 [Ktedonobacteraceae bacterium]|nr:hypothetical protein [Ktedonobacteraceae bacterium]